MTSDAGSNELMLPKIDFVFKLIFGDEKHKGITIGFLSAVLQYCKWTDDGRWELIDGVEYDMSPAPSRMHQKLSGELFVRIYTVLKDRRCDVYAAPFDVRLADYAEASDEDIFTVVQPDIVVVCDKLKLDERGCVGAPDL